MNDLKIRNYKKDDFISVKQILIESNLFDEAWDEEKRLSLRITQKSDSILVAIIGEEVVGCVYLVDDILPFIFRLAVKKAYQRQGIGTMLVKEATKRLKKHGHSEIVLFVDNEKEALKNWYRKQGFKEGKSLWRGFRKQLD